MALQLVEVRLICLELGTCLVHVGLQLVRGLLDVSLRIADVVVGGIASNIDLLPAILRRQSVREAPQSYRTKCVDENPYKPL